MYPNMVAIMSQKGLTIEAIANALHKHRNTISNKVNGDGEFTFEEASIVCDAFFPEYRPSYVLRRSDPK